MPGGGGAGWLLPRRARTLAGHRVGVSRRGGGGGRAVVDGVAVAACDLVAANGVVHGVDAFLPSAMRTAVWELSRDVPRDTGSRDRAAARALARLTSSRRRSRH